MKSFKTAKGTELPLLDLRGKPYLQVAHRIVWMREEHPEWRIKTSVSYDLKEAWAVGQASILDGQGNEMATAHKFENAQGFGDFIEKAETGAIGRALALCGYGTQFAPEFDEGERLADSPIAPAKPRPVAVTPQWTKDQMREYSTAKWGISDARVLDIEKLDELAALSKSKPFRVAMSDLGVK